MIINKLDIVWIDDNFYVCYMVDGEHAILKHYDFDILREDVSIPNLGFCFGTSGRHGLLTINRDTSFYNIKNPNIEAWKDYLGEDNSQVIVVGRVTALRCGNAQWSLSLFFKIDKLKKYGKILAKKLWDGVNPVEVRIPADGLKCGTQCGTQCGTPVSDYPNETGVKTFGFYSGKGARLGLKEGHLEDAKNKSVRQVKISSRVKPGKKKTKSKK